MEISLADERSFLLQAQLTLDQAEGRAWSRKVDAFGNVERVTRLIRRPQEDDFELTYKEHRYQPFWHVECNARYVYERRREYPLPIESAEIKAVTINGTEYPVNNGRITLQGVEHCLEEPHVEQFIDGYTNEQQPSLHKYLQFSANEIPIADIDELGKDNNIIVVPPQSRATAVVRDVLLNVLKSLHADQIIEDIIEIKRIDLYYRPIYAFQYRWLSKQKEAILEYDAVTGELHSDGKTFQQYIGQILDPEFLFDVGVDSIDLFVPGGGIAVKLARKGYNMARPKPDK